MFNRYLRISGLSIVDVLNFIISILLFVDVVNAFLPQLLISLHVEYRYIYTVIFRILLISLLVAKIFFVRKPLVLSKIAFPLVVFLIYLYFASVYNSLFLPISYLFWGVYGHYFYFFLIPLLLISMPPVKGALVTAFLVSISGVGLIGIMQYFFNNTFLPTSDPLGEFKIISWLFLDSNPQRVRGFSLFSNALDFGIVLIFFLGISLFLCFDKRKFFYGFLSAILLLAIFSTYTRNVYLGAILAICGVTAYKFLKNRKYLFILPLISLFFGVGIAQSSLFFESQDATVRTLIVRGDIWSEVIKEKETSRTVAALLGEGVYQTGEEDGDANLFVDNSYLHLIVQIGFIGLIILFFFYIILLGGVVRKRPDEVSCALFAFLCAWPAMANFNTITAQLGLIIVIALFLGRRTQNEKL